MVRMRISIPSQIPTPFGKLHAQGGLQDGTLRSHGGEEAEQPAESRFGAEHAEPSCTKALRSEAAQGPNEP